MISIFMSINNNEQVIELPVIPEEIDLDAPFSNDTFDGVRQTLNIFGLRGLRQVNIESFFPISDYPFLRSRDLWGMEYVAMIQHWRDRKLPIRLIITNTDRGGMRVNMPVTIDNFTYGTDKSGDINYRMSMREFVFVEVR